MSFVNEGLLYALGFIAVPVMLHLLMRAKPKKLMFPALRLVQQRRLQNVRRMRLKHLGLLLLRMAVLAAIALAVARPSLPPADYSMTWTEISILAGIVAIATAVGLGVERAWRKSKLPQHVLSARQTYFRSGLVAVAVLLAALLVGWPYQHRLAEAMSSPLPTVATDTPVAAVFLFDSSLSMAYTREGETRLDVAKRIANQHLATLPSRSRVAVGDSATNEPVLFQADLSAAKNRVEGIKSAIVSVPLNDRLRAALTMQEDDRTRILAELPDAEVDDRSDGLIREVYLFTDLAQSAWAKSPGRFLQDELKRLAWLGVYVIDVGVEQPRNMALTKLRLTQECIAEGGLTNLAASLPSVGFADQDQVVELWLAAPGGDLVKKDQRTVKLTDSAVPEVQFMLSGLSRRIERGQLRLVSSDPLVEDNRLDFAVRVDPTIRVLITSPREDEGDELLTGLEVLQYRVSYVPQAKLEATDLSAFDVVCFVNVNGSSEKLWKKVSDYVAAGGGLAVILGAELGPAVGINVEGYNSEAAKAVLPAAIEFPLNFRPAKSLDLKDTSHPLIKKFDGPGVAAELMSVDIRRYWRVKTQPDAKVIVPYADNEARPAFIERMHGLGRTVMVTTSFDLKGEWNELPRQSPAYFLMLVDQLMQYLSRRTEARVNFVAGETALVPLNREKPIKDYLLRKPSGVQLPGKIADGAVELSISPLDERGQFGVLSAQAETPFEAGFAVNPPPEESDFTRLSTADLDQWLGEKRYSVATSIDGLEKSVTTGRLGVEAFPTVLAMLLIAFCLEHLAANRFYQADKQA